MLLIINKWRIRERIRNVRKKYSINGLESLNEKLIIGEREKLDRL